MHLTNIDCTHRSLGSSPLVHHILYLLSWLRIWIYHIWRFIKWVCLWLGANQFSGSIFHTFQNLIEFEILNLHNNGSDEATCCLLRFLSVNSCSRRWILLIFILDFFLIVICTLGLNMLWKMGFVNFTFSLVVRASYNMVIFIFCKIVFDVLNWIVWWIESIFPFFFWTELF